MLENARTDWIAACDALEFAQDSGRTADEMLALETACSDFYDAMIACKDAATVSEAPIVSATPTLDRLRKLANVAPYAPARRETIIHDCDGGDSPCYCG